MHLVAAKVDSIRRNPWIPLAEPLGSVEPRLKNTELEAYWLSSKWTLVLNHTTVRQLMV